MSMQTEIIFAMVNIALAAWRIYSLLGHEAGPKNVLRTIRKRVGVRYQSDDPASPDYNKIIGGPGSFAEGLCCPWCSGLWYSTILWIAYLALGWPMMLAIAPLSISALVIKADKILNGYH